jgi:predicted RNase H-like nuclease
MDPRVLGVDACKKGWVGIDSLGNGYFAAGIAELVDAAEVHGRIEVLAVDIPIGLPAQGSRAADLLARKKVGPRYSSVFPTPLRAVLIEPDFGPANAVSKALMGKGISKQAHGLRAKILEVDGWIREANQRVIEVHPEVSFAAMNEAPLEHPKSTWAGIEQRRRLLQANGFAPELDRVGPAGIKAAVDDVLDAMAACWTARRFAEDRASSLPDPPEYFEGEHPAAIWY